MNRYIVYDGSASAHCCFESTVVDTTKPYYVHGKHFVDSNGRKSYEEICECFDTKDAELICEALNLLAKRKNKKSK